MLTACGGDHGQPPPPAPTITTFIAAPATIEPGQTSTLSWSVANASSLTLDQGIGPVNGSSVQVTPAVSTTYTLTASNGFQSVTATAQVGVAVNPVQPVVSANNPVTAGLTYTASVPAQAGCTYAWTIDGQPVPQDPSLNTVQYTAGASGTETISCTVSNALGIASAPGTASETIVPAPQTPVITLQPATVTAGAPFTATVPAQPAGITYGWTVLNGSTPPGVQGNQITITAGTAGPVQVECEAGNAALTASTGTATGVVLALPVISSFTTAQPSVGPGGSATLTPVFTVDPAGSAVVNPGNVTVASGQAIPTGALATGTTFTLTVTNGAGTAVSATARVLVGTVSVLAGTPAGVGALDGTLAAARFNDPCGVALDPASGNLYVADTVNSVIRRITPGGAVSTLAGTAGYTGSADGTGAAARFNEPNGLAVDGSGNLIVADTFNHLIRMVTPAGVVSTVAGKAGVAGLNNGTGTIALFSTPSGVAVDGAGNIYVADTGNNLIRRITAGLVSSYAGTGLKSVFNGPAGVAVDGAGNVYVADTLNNRVRLVTPAGVVTTLAGNASGSGSADGTGTAARFARPSGVAVDPAGNVYVPDFKNDTIRKITPAGAVTTLAGQAQVTGSADGTGTAAAFNGPSGVAADASGNIYVADTFNNTIRRVTPAGGVSLFAGQAGNPGDSDGTGALAAFDEPLGVAVDAAGNLYVADSVNDSIRKITPAGAVSLFAGTPGASGSSDGPPAEFNGPDGMATDATGNVYVADIQNHVIRRITPAGAVSLFAGTPGTPGSSDQPPATFNAPEGVAVDAAGNVYVADTQNHTIRVITPAGAVSTLAGTAGSSGGADGQGSAARFNLPADVAVDAAGNVYVADTGNHTIRMVTATGLVSTLAGSAGSSGSMDGPGATALFDTPEGLAVDGSGNLFVADRGNSAIRLVTTGPAPMVTTLVGVPGPGAIVPGPLPALLAWPEAVAVDSSGNLYLTVEDAILKVTFN